MALSPGVLYEWPWEDTVSLKYLYFVPFVASAALGCDDEDNWCLHTTIIIFIRSVDLEC